MTSFCQGDLLLPFPFCMIWFFLLWRIWKKIPVFITRCQDCEDVEQNSKSSSAWKVYYPFHFVVACRVLILTWWKPKWKRSRISFQPVSIMNCLQCFEIGTVLLLHSVNNETLAENLTAFFNVLSNTNFTIKKKKEMRNFLCLTDTYSILGN